MIDSQQEKEVRKVVSLSASTYYYVDFLKEVEQEIQEKAFLVRAGLDNFSKAETFAYWALMANGYFFVPPESTNEEQLDD